MTATVPVWAARVANSAAVELTQLLRQYQTYQARFVQTSFQSDGARPRVSAGQVMMQRPGKFRWEIFKPSQQIIVTNGTDLWVYDVALQQVTRQKVRRGVLSPAYLLSGNVATLMRQYKVVLINLAGKQAYQLTPRTKSSDFSVVRMYFTRGKLTEMWVKNNLGTISQFSFHDIKINQPLKASLFNFTPPPGVDVLS